MANFEDLKFEAFKGKRKQQEERGRQLNEKVQGVTDAKDELLKADVSAGETLQTYKKTRARKKGLEEQFAEIIKDDTTREYLEGQGILTLADYVKSEAGKGNELTGEYIESQKALADLRAELKLAVGPKSEEEEIGKKTEGGTRTAAKDKLLAELQKNDPEVKTRTFKGLKEEANQQVEGIREKEVLKLVDELLTTSEVSVRHYLTQVCEQNKRPDIYPNIVSKNDIIKLGEYGQGYAREATKLFQTKLEELIPTVVAGWHEGLDSQVKDNIFSSLIDKRIGSVASISQRIIEQMRRDLARATEEVGNMDQKIKVEKDAERMVRMPQEVEQAFSKLDDVVRYSQSPYLPEGFGRNADSFSVTFKVLGGENPLAKYFNHDYSGSIHGFLGNEQLAEKLEILEEDLAEAQGEESKAQRARASFHRRNFLYKMFNPSINKETRNRLSEGTSQVEMINNIKVLFSGLHEFMDTMFKLEKENNVSPWFSQETTSLKHLKDSYLATLSEQLNPRRRGRG